MTSAKNQPSAEWETAAEEAPTRVVFDTIGDVFLGFYQGTNEVKMDDGTSFTQYLFRGSDGVLYAINESYKIKQGMANVPEGHETRVEYVKDVDTGRPSPMRDFRIQHRAPAA